MPGLRALLVVTTLHAVAVAVPCARAMPARPAAPCHDSRTPTPPDHDRSCPSFLCPAGSAAAVLPSPLERTTSLQPVHRAGMPQPAAAPHSVALTIDPPPPRG
jgi:hypothetical protein